MNDEKLYLEAHKYFTAVEFMMLFKDHAADIIEIIQKEFPEETKNLRIYLDGKTPSPVARLLKEYKVDD